MPYNNHKNNSFSTGRSSNSNKKKRGAGGRKKRCDGTKKQQNESAAVEDLEQEDYNRAASPLVAGEQSLDNSAGAEPSCDNAIAISENEIEIVKEENDGSGTADCSETISDDVVVESTEADNNNEDDDVTSSATENDEAPADVGEKIDTLGELNGFHIHDNNAADAIAEPRIDENENLCEISTKSIVGDNETVAELEKNETTDLDLAAINVPDHVGAIGEFNSNSNDGVCPSDDAATVNGDPENNNKDCNGNNRWSIESILFNNNSSSDKPIEQNNKGDTVDEHQSPPTIIEASTAAAVLTVGSLQPRNYGSTGFQIDAEAEVDKEAEQQHQHSINGNSAIEEGSANCESVESIASVPMGAEVGNKSSNSDLIGGGGGQPLSKSSSFSSNSSGNTSSTIIFTGHTGIGQLKE